MGSNPILATILHPAKFITGGNIMKKEVARFYIPIRPVTKKNNMQISRTANGRVGIRQSKRYVNYEKSVLEWWFELMDSQTQENPQVLVPDRPIDYKINIKSIYGLPTRQKADLINYHSALHDILTKMGVIEDDEWKILYSTDGSRVVIDRANPGTLVVIEAYLDKDGNYVYL